MSAPPPLTLPQARERLKELGYLTGPVERFVFRRAFEGRGGQLLPAALLGAAAASLASVAAVATAEPGFSTSPASAFVLFLHLALANLLPASAAAFALGLAADRSRAPAAVATSLGAAAAVLIFFLWLGGARSLSEDWPAGSLLWGAPVTLAALLAATAVRSGFLARAFLRSRILPARRRRWVLAGAAATGLAAAAILAAARSEPSAPAAPRPSPRQEKLVVVAVDGLRLDEGRSPGVALLLKGAAQGWWPGRAASPPEIWTDLATGEPASRHGVRALERVRVNGAPRAVRPPLGTRWYLRHVAPALRLASSAPVSAADRRRLTFWEVSASAGLSGAAVGWWASGEWPGASVLDNRELLARATGGLEADRLAMEAFTKERGKQVSTVYLPGLDILRSDAPVRAEALGRIERFLGEEVSRAARGETVLVVLSEESHGTPGHLGRLAVFDGAGAREVRIRPYDAAPSLLARAGIPVARDLPGAPVPALFREGSLETATVPTYGVRIAPRRVPATSDREYLEKLRSLGYLN